MLPRLLGYAAVRQGCADGTWGPVVLGELPPSLVHPVFRLVDPSEEPFAVMASSTGVRLTAARSSVRSAWEITDWVFGLCAEPISIDEVFGSIARLYGLPAEAGWPLDDFARRYRISVTARAAELAQVAVLA